MNRPVLLLAAVSLIFAVPGVAHAETERPVCPDCTTDTTEISSTGDSYKLGTGRSEGSGDLGADGAEGVGQTAGYEGPSYWTVTMTSSDTQASCFRPTWNAGVPPDETNTYDSRAAAAVGGIGEMPAWLGEGGDAWRPGDFVPACVIEPGEVGPEPPSPLEIAMSGWYSSAVTVAPSVTVEPEAHDYTLVGLPTIIAIDDYNPAVDIDSDPRTITWSFGSIELRATAQHRFSWDDGGVVDTGWVSSNGRGYVEGDETGEYADPQPFAHVYEVAGERAVQIEVRWSGEWRNTGGVWEPLPVGPIFQSLTEAVDVQQRQAVITG